MLTTNAEFHELSSAIYRNRMLQSQLKIFVKILSVICAHMVDFCRLSSVVVSGCVVGMYAHAEHYGVAVIIIIIIAS